MEPLVITLYGDIPSKKNSKRIIYRHGRPLIISSSNYVSWEKGALLEIKKQYKNKPLEKVEKMVMTFFPSTKRKSDLSNKWEGVADALVKGGVLVDDNWFVIPEAVMRFGCVDKSNPHVVVVIYTC